MDYCPLHPGTHLTNRSSLERDYRVWVCASPPTRSRIINDILYELEAFGDVYHTHAYAMEQGIDVD